MHGLEDHIWQSRDGAAQQICHCVVAKGKGNVQRRPPRKVWPEGVKRQRAGNRSELLLSGRDGCGRSLREVQAAASRAQVWARILTKQLRHHRQMAPQHRIVKARAAAKVSLIGHNGHLSG